MTGLSTSVSASGSGNRTMRSVCRENSTSASPNFLCWIRKSNRSSKLCACNGVKDASPAADAKPTAAPRNVEAHPPLQPGRFAPSFAAPSLDLSVKKPRGEKTSTQFLILFGNAPPGLKPARRQPRKPAHCSHAVTLRLSVYDAPEMSTRSSSIRSTVSPNVNSRVSNNASTSPTLNKPRMRRSRSSGSSISTLTAV